MPNSVVDSSKGPSLFFFSGLHRSNKTLENEHVLRQLPDFAHTDRVLSGFVSCNPKCFSVMVLAVVLGRDAPTRPTRAGSPCFCSLQRAPVRRASGERINLQGSEQHVLTSLPQLQMHRSVPYHTRICQRHGGAIARRLLIVRTPLRTMNTPHHPPHFHRLCVTPPHPPRSELGGWFLTSLTIDGQPPT